MRAFTGRRRVVIAALALTLAALASCRYHRTQAMVRVDTDMDQGPGRALTAVRIVVRGPETDRAPVADVTAPLGVAGERGTLWLPDDLLAVEPRGDDPSRELTVEVSALRDARTLFTTRRRTTLRANAAASVQLFLAARCVETNCPPGETCGLLGCESERAAEPPPVFSADAGPGNILGNPSFEDGTGGWGGGNCTLTREAIEGAPDGRYVARLSAPTARDCVLFDYPDTLSFVPAGQVYLLSAYVRAASASSIGRLLVLGGRATALDGPTPRERQSVTPPLVLTAMFQRLSTTLAFDRDGTLTLYIDMLGSQPTDAYEIDRIEVRRLR